MERTIVFGHTDAKGMKVVIGLCFATEAAEVTALLCKSRITIVVELQC